MASLLATWALISASGRFFGRDGRFFWRVGAFLGEMGAFLAKFPFWESLRDIYVRVWALFSNFLFGKVHQTLMAGLGAYFRISFLGMMM